MQIQELITLVERVGFPIALSLILIALLVLLLYEAKEVLNRNTNAIEQLTRANERLAEGIGELSKKIDDTQGPHLPKIRTRP